MKKMLDYYAGVFNIIRRYWQEYGGWKAVLLSPYFHVALLLTLALSPYWRHEAWWNDALAVLPNIIGFAIGGYAIWIGFGDEEFRKRISQRTRDGKSSPYLVVSAAFAHFVIVQLCALLGAIIAKATYFQIIESDWLGQLLLKADLPVTWVHDTLAPWFWGFGFLLFVYGLMTAFAATLAIFRVTDWFVRVKNSPKKDTDQAESTTSDDSAA